MTLIWPTTNDVHLDDESDSSSSYRANNLGNEDLWKTLWQSISPTTGGSWIPESFELDLSVTLPTDTLTFVLTRGRAIIDGFTLDFSGETGAVEIPMENSEYGEDDDGHIHLSLQLVYTDGRVSGYQWRQDIDDPVVRTGQITVGMAIVKTSVDGWRVWNPYSFPEGPRIMAGNYDSSTSPTHKSVGLGFRPIAMGGGVSSNSIQDYGFRLDGSGTGTFEAATFHKT